MIYNQLSGVSLFLEVLLTRGFVAGRVREGHISALALGESFLKQCPKQGLPVHSEEIIKGGGGHWISPLCTVLKIEHQSVILTY